MVGSQFIAYFQTGTSGAATVTPATRPTSLLERRIADVLRIRTNTIAGRPNVGNLALEFTHKGRHVPAAVLRDYVLRTLRSFIPNVTFSVKVADGLDANGFQEVAIRYEAA